MRIRRLGAAGALTIVVAAGYYAPVRTVAQTSRSGQSETKSAPNTVPRTPDGRPDLQGVWNFATVTPLERPTQFADKEFLTPEEAEAFEKEIVATRSTDRRDGGAQSDVSRAYNDFWVDWGTKVVRTRRTSLIIDPPNGRMPSMTAEGAKQQAARLQMADQPARGPEDLNLSTRCIVGFNAGPPMLTGPYNNNVQIVQTSTHVVVLNEMNHDARIIPLDGRPHVSSVIRLWSGDSRGRWEGNTLVVETTNFGPMGEIGFRVFDNTRMRLTERFTRVDDGNLLYEFTVNDPGRWIQPWTVSLPMTRTQDQIYEYACHEGNYAMAGILSASRAADKGIPEQPVPR